MLQGPKSPKMMLASKDKAEGSIPARSKSKVRSSIPPPLGLTLMLKLPTLITDLFRRKDYTLNRALVSRLVELKVAPKPKSKRVCSTDITVDNSTGTWVRIFTPISESSKLPVILYYPGGAFTALSPAFLLYDKFCRRLARKANCVVVSADYRKAPENKYPAAHEDGYNVLKWLQEGGGLPEKADLSRVFLMGDSAGGNLVHFVGCRAAQEDLKPILIKGHVLIQPYFGGEERTPAEIRMTRVPIVSVQATDWHWKAYLGEHENRDHPVCNVFGPRSDGVPAVGLPPSLVIVGEHDPLQDWQIRYAEGLRKGGHHVGLIFYRGAVHAFHIFPYFKLYHKVLGDICSFVAQHSS